ncbi:N-formylglutamate amidohydrolase [Acetobacter oeni]|uniref:N-formylglutamate amidohydrolase n=1 Tax=Acetobacter oeni TaxID=304077 RepID=A0A511XKL2_9PROT|nr:N-formylglutamate amidohydrolase [Acetobacter oeni]MBB3881327.1 putative N-formylglutamate amidohydrolase [Acetobacter oeni]NHO18199.1 N-formylglutamate amidohydrolase [Acetobacter oeni]GBR11339.1 N-formylglutamate amidohydrolase [Acetobacter oeni LMG 21952]GEN63479.1 N-formylglutamate amidohydrolase [Acetobacter oeni]
MTTTGSKHNEPTTLLRAGDPEPVRVHGSAGSQSPFLLVSDHAGRAIPTALATLGVPEKDLSRHIGWDIGIDGLGRLLARQLGALLIEQTYSRLVIDCNRAPGHPTAIVTVSDGTPVPANADLPAGAASMRTLEIFEPYHTRIGEELDRRTEAGLETFLVALHSFTPEMHGLKRPWQAGVLHNHDPRFGRLLIDILLEEGLVTGDNEPYELTDTSDYTVPVHGERRRIPHVELEIRQDLIASEAGQAEWASRLAKALNEARARYHTQYGKHPDQESQP